MEGWMREFFIDKGSLFALVLKSKREKGVSEARQVARLLEAHGVPRGARILELGCGDGRIAVPLAAEGYMVTCLDISPVLLREAAEYATDMGVDDRITLVEADAWSLEEHLEPGYDTVLLYWTTLLGYKGTPKEDEKLLASAAMITRPGGKLLILNQTHRDLIIATQARCPRRHIYNVLGDGYVMIEEPRFDPVTSMLSNTWSYYKETGQGLSLLGRASFTIRIYTVTEIIGIAGEAGWRLEALYGSPARDPYDTVRSGFNGVFTKPAASQ